MKVSDYVVDAIQKRTGIGHVFTLTGGMAMHLVESFGRHPKIRVIPVHHEQAGGIAANAYGRILETAGCALVTAGPGALNAVTPCAGAWMESNPMVFLSGQVSRANSTQGHSVRQRGVQEVNIVEIVRSITKYAIRIDDPNTVRYHVEQALSLAFEGRPGPVWIDIPVDVQGADINPDEQAVFEPKSETWDLSALPEIIGRLKAAKRPLLIIGQGVRLSGAAQRVVSFVEALGIPVQTTWNGMDLIEEAHPLFAGRSNLFGPRYANLIVQNADVILGIGARFGLQHTGYNVAAFARNAHLIMVEIDPSEATKPGLGVDTFVHADAGVFMDELRAQYKSATTADRNEWFQYCADVRRTFPPAQDPGVLVADGFVQPQTFMFTLGKFLPSDAVFMIGSSGMGHTVAGGIFPVRAGQRAFTFKGLAGMGYGVPSALGAAIASPGRPVLTVVGEGGLQLNIQELQTIRHHNLPVTVIVFNNGGYHSIHMTQKGYFNGHYVGSGPESDVTFPDLAGLADLYGYSYTTIKTNGEVEARLSTFDWVAGPAFLEVFIDPDKALEPKVVSYQKTDGRMESRPIEDMGPLLDREVLRKWMMNPLLEELS